MHLKNLEEDLLDRIIRAVAPELDRLRKQSAGDPPHRGDNQRSRQSLNSARENESELMCEVP